MSPAAADCPPPTVPQPPQPLASKFFVFMAFMVLCQQAAVSLAQAVSAICRDVDTSGGLGGARHL